MAGIGTELVRRCCSCLLCRYEQSGGSTVRLRRWCVSAGRCGGLRVAMVCISVIMDSARSVLCVMLATGFAKASGLWRQAVCSKRFGLQSSHNVDEDHRDTMFCTSLMLLLVFTHNKIVANIRARVLTSSRVGQGALLRQASQPRTMQRPGTPA
jgi:hypothetical protein